MFRVPRLCTKVTVIGGACVRAYTPVYTPEPREDHLRPLRTADEAAALWCNAAPVASLDRAVATWLRYGNDPVVHTVGLDPAVSAASPFAYLEDYMGTNMVSGSPSHVKESAALWSSYFEKKYVGRMRRSRRTSNQFIGLLSGRSGPAAADGGDAANASRAMAWTDEADKPNTKWDQDVFFREVAYLSERHLKTKVSNYLQLEQALWQKAEAESFLAFFDGFQQQTTTRIPLPVPAVWVYEGEARKQWAERYLPAAKAAVQFFQTKLQPVASKNGGNNGSAVLAKVAESMKAVHQVLLERHDRQVKAGLSPSWGTNSRADPTQRSNESEVAQAWVANEIEKEQRRVEEGVFDPEDLLDTAAEWSAEHDKITQIIQKPLGEGLNFTLEEFWIHTVRREALETAHILGTESLRCVAAAALRRLLEEDGLATTLAGLEESIAKGQLDLRGCFLKPHCNPTWCKLHYVKFGASSIVQHTHTASRQLLFHTASSTHEVAAAAALYFGTKPLSSQVDYTSPYTMRRSVAQLCAVYGTEMAYAAQRPYLTSAAHMANATVAMRQIAEEVARPFGLRRRARFRKVQADQQRLLSPVKDVQLAAVPSELLAAGADVQRVRETTTALAKGQPMEASASASWPLGSRRVVQYKWATPALEQLRLAVQADGGGGNGAGLTAAKARELEELRRRGRIEISLWRRRTPEEVAARLKKTQEESAVVSKLCRESPALEQVAQYAAQLYARLSGEATQEEQKAPVASAKEDNEEEWAFAIMLDDAAALNEHEAAVVYLPYKDAQGAPLPAGQYRVRVRAFDADLNPTQHVTLSSEAVSSPFTVSNVASAVIKSFAAKVGGSSAPAKDGDADAVSGDMDGAQLIPLCQALRDAGLDVPLRLEFEVGQSLDKQGKFSLSELMSHLASAEFHESLAEKGITAQQRAIEGRCKAHWALHNAGATAAEWAGARRAVLQEAMQRERDWWLQDPLLDIVDPRTGYSSAPSVDISIYPATARYATELCAVLPASSSNHEPHIIAPPAPGSKTAVLHADCTVDGTGAITSLHYGAPVSEATSAVTMDDALQAALSAMQGAQARHATLSMVKTGAYDAQTQLAMFAGVHGLEFGGKYARSYVYAVDKAKKEMEEAAEGAQAVAPFTADGEKERLTEAEKVDRYASETHPELRKTHFVPRVGMHGYSIENPTGDQMPTWGQQ